MFQVPLGVIPKNESSNADMMDILELIQENYVPTQDIKTNEQGQERETNFRGAGTQYSESKSGWENYFRETRYIPKNEDRHAIGTGYTK